MSINSGQDQFVMKAMSMILNIEANRDKNKLSIQETLCLMLLSSGENPDKCADLLGISVKTVTTYEQRYRKKLGAKNRTNAFFLAQVRGYISILPHAA